MQNMQHDPRCGAILCAAEEELAPFLPHLAEEQRLSRAMLTLHIGRIGDLQMVLAATGICKVNAALAVQTVLDTVSPDFVLNAGTAGGMSPALGLFETAVTTECAYHDVAEAILTESHPHLPSVWFASDPDLLAACRRAAERAPGRVHFGRTVTGEAFITDEGRAEINARFAPLTVDMETAAMAHVCYVNRIPFAAIRSVTDTADHSGMGTFEENCARAAAVSAAVVLDVLRELTR